MNSDEIRKRFLTFFEKRGHTVIPSASLVPENDPSVLFTTAGMQPLVPYLLGEKHPSGKRLVDVQKCVRTQDIGEVGDNTHDTFFEMLGNWSLGEYFKEDAIKWSYELLTSKEEGFGLDPARLYVTVFEGDENAPKDTESFEIWRNLGIPENRIYFMSAKSNWWSAGDNGPCGPDTEMFYDITSEGLNLTSKEEFEKADEKQQVVEIWNDVFMEYEKKDGKVIGKLKNRNVDTGAGLERLCMVLQNKKSIFETDLFESIMEKIRKLNTSGMVNRLAERVIADHVRTATFMIGDGVLPSNTDRGYILRRLIRRATRFADTLGMGEDSLLLVAEVVQEKYKHVYENLNIDNGIQIRKIIKGEESKFRETLKQGLKEFEKAVQVHVNKEPFLKELPSEIVFNLYTTYGFPIELIEEEAKVRGITFDKAGVEEKIKKHQALSRTSSAGMFKGGLANHNEQTIKLHTAHHLLLSALQEVLGKEVKQRGSNITEERLRIDFASPRKLTPEEIKKVEEIVNTRIKEDLTVVRREMPRIEAESLGAEMEFGAKYPEVVSIYFIEDRNGNAISKEFCGGPHVGHTSELGTFKILKEEAVSAGVRRIKAVLS